MKELVRPDFTNSLVNLTSSIKKHFNPNLPLKYPSIPKVDEMLEGKKHVVVVLLDGCGINIIENNLPKEAFLRTHLAHKMTSIFPSTTVAATNTVLQGCLPGESGWFGWHQYIKELDHHVIMFTNTDYYTGEKVDANVKNKYVKMHEFGLDLKVKYRTLFPAFRQDGYANFADMAQKIVDITHEAKPSYTYAYWEYPDGLIHEYGCYNEIIKANLLNLSESLEKIEKEKSEDSVVLVIADHGLTDVSPIRLEFYPEVTQYLTNLPSLEGRATIFYTNADVEFEHEFNKNFGKWFNLMTSKEFLDSGLVGKDTKMVEPFLGDYIAIAKDKYYFSYTVEGNDFLAIKGHHAGLTEDEMYVPVVLIK